MNEKTIKFNNVEKDDLTRIDIFLNKKLNSLSRSYIKYLIQSGYLKVNDFVIKSPSYKVKKNDNIEFKLKKKKCSKFKAL